MRRISSSGIDECTSIQDEHQVIPRFFSYSARTRSLSVFGLAMQVWLHCFSPGRAP